jgi:hypothetical protein
MLSCRGLCQGLQRHDVSGCWSPAWPHVERPQRHERRGRWSPGCGLLTAERTAATERVLGDAGHLSAALTPSLTAGRRHDAACCQILVTRVLLKRPQRHKRVGGCWSPGAAATMSDRSAERTGMLLPSAAYDERPQAPMSVSWDAGHLGAAVRSSGL